MTATAALPAESAAYLDQVRAALADLPAEERDELLSDVEVSLLEDAADDGETPELRLGPPDRFARELRAAAGLTETAAPPAPAADPGALARLQARLRDAAGSEHFIAARATAHELAPIWWAARGYLAVGALAMFTGATFTGSLLVPVSGGLFGLLITLAAVGGSIWLGLRSRRTRHLRRWIIALNVGVALMAFPVLERISSAGVGGDVAYYGEPAPLDTVGLNVNGAPLQNVYPYSRDGELLLDVLLYDQDGQPLDVGTPDREQDPLRRYLIAKDGRALLNAFPVRYVEPGTSKVADPLAAPDIEVPEVETPPLEVKRRGSARRGG